MNNRELLATTLLKHVLDNKAIQLTEDSWKIENIDIGDGSKTYIVRNTKKLGKFSGKYFFKRNLYKLENDKEKLIELGEYKKLYLYKIVKQLTKPKTERVLLKQDYSEQEMRDIAKYVKTHYKDFHFDENGSFVGDIPQGHMLITKGYIKNMKNNHNRLFGRQMFINGVLVQEGYFLDWPVNQYIKMMNNNN